MNKIKQLKNNRSKKHHYLPRHYLQGFVNNEGCFYIYDKQNNTILPKSLPPGAVFFVNNLNTVTLPSGEVSDFLEKYYAIIENLSWPSLDMIRNSNRLTPIPLLGKMHLFLFLSSLHWRLPSNIKHVESLSKKYFTKDNKYFNYFTLINRSRDGLPKGILNEMKDSPAFKNYSKLMLSFTPFFVGDCDWSEKLENNWKLLYTGDGNSWNIIGDNPIITKGVNDHDPVNCLSEFVFPISGKILLVNTKKPLNHDCPPEFTVQLNISIIERSHRFVACQNLEFLDVLIKYYNLYVKNNKEDSIITEFFDMLK